MTEETPFKPTSRKGEVRAAIARTLMDAVGRGELRGMIVRAADFYGPGATLSFTDAVVTKRLLAGKTPQWIGNPKALHTFSYTPDVAYSLARLGNIPSAYGQTWHALTSPEPMSGERYVRLACEVMGLPYRLQVAPRWMLSLMGVFNPVVRENMEMLYQFEHDYVFDSTKTVHALLREPTPYREGLAATLNREKGRSSPPPPS
jgi:nucleoside-diphosphate-sugar epimerase